MALHLNKKTLLALLVAVVFIAVAVYLTLMFTWPRPAPTLVTHYQCSDGSYYLIVDAADQLTVSGQTFELIPDSTPRRFGNNGGTEFEIDAAVLTVRNTVDDSVVASCSAQAPEFDFVNAGQERN